MKQWDVDWRERVLASAAPISAGVEGWQSFKTPGIATSSGDLLPDGVTVCPPGFNANTRWDTGSPSAFTQVARYASSFLGTYLNGDWTVNNAINWRFAMTKLSGNSPCRFLRRRANGNLATTAVDFETTLVPSSDWQAVDFSGAASGVVASGVNGEEWFLDLNFGDKTNKGVCLGGYAISIDGKADGFGLRFSAAGGWTALDHLPVSLGGTNTLVDLDDLQARNGVFGWPTAIFIQLGQNDAGLTDGTTPTGIANYKSRLLQLIDHYNIAYAASAQPTPMFVLVCNWETSGLGAYWPSIATSLQEICDERSNCGLLNLYQIVNEEHGSFASWQGTYLADGVHQNTAGASEFARLAWNELQVAAVTGIVVLTNGIGSFGYTKSWGY